MPGLWSLNSGLWTLTCAQLRNYLTTTLKHLGVTCSHHTSEQNQTSELLLYHTVNLHLRVYKTTTRSLSKQRWPYIIP
jgi:hypothetical protein